MKILVTICRILVGLLFIFSGLVKANDPHGLSYKMQEFFEVWGVHGLNDFTLPLSILMNAFEIIAGVALLLGWRIRLFIWLLLVLIVAFTFLTGYTYVTGKPKNCGCFGDCLPISSAFSFYKDVILTVLIGFLLWQKNKIKPLFSARGNLLVMALAVLFSFGLQGYALKYLPPVDCLPYKKGKNIEQQMQIPANAVPDSMVISFVYEKEGKKMEFTSDNFPAGFDKSYKFIERKDKVVKQGKNNVPPIVGFNLQGQDGGDYTSMVLQLPSVILIIIEDYTALPNNWVRKMTPVYALAKEKNIPIYIVSGSFKETENILKNTPLEGLTVYTCDFTAIRTAARVSPTIYFLEKGTVIEKQPLSGVNAISELVKKADAITPPPTVTETIVDSL